MAKALNVGSFLPPIVAHCSKALPHLMPGKRIEDSSKHPRWRAKRRHRSIWVLPSEELKYRADANQPRYPPSEWRPALLTYLSSLESILGNELSLIVWSGPP